MALRKTYVDPQWAIISRGMSAPRYDRCSLVKYSKTGPYGTVLYALRCWKKFSDKVATVE